MWLKTWLTSIMQNLQGWDLCLHIIGQAETYLHDTRTMGLCFQAHISSHMWKIISFQFSQIVWIEQFQTYNVQTYILLNNWLWNLYWLFKNIYHQIITIGTGIFQGVFEIPTISFCSCIERCVFSPRIESYITFALRTHKCFWNGP